jgi:hypothetical protein
MLLGRDRRRRRRREGLVRRGWGMGGGWDLPPQLSILCLNWAEFFITVYQHLLYLLFSFGKFYPVQPMWRKLRKIVFVLIVLVNSFLFLPHNILINFPL